MRRILSVAGGLMLVLAITSGSPRAQLSEILRHNLQNMTEPDPFLCQTSCATGGLEQQCNLWNRLYGDKKPDLGINGPASPTNDCTEDGYPRFGSVNVRMLGDAQNTSNYPGINASADACEAWYSIWDGVTSPEVGTFISYYGASSTIVNALEDGFPNCAACDATCGGVVQQGVCFGTLTTASSAGTAIDNTPQGLINPFGAMAPVPVVLITASDLDLNTLGLTWNALTDITTVNRASTMGPSCPAGSTFNDAAGGNGPNPIRGLRLFVHTEPETASSRSLASLEGSTLTGGNILNAFGNTRDGICFASDSGQPGPPPGQCPDSHVIPCNGVVGGACNANGIDFAPSVQSIVLSETAVNAALGADGPVGANAIVFNTKVVYAGATETASAAGASSLNPKLVSVFSANSVKAGFGGLVSGVQFDEAATVVRGNRITLTWTAVGTFTEFRLQRAFDGISWTDIATIPATSAPSYAYTDEIRGRSASRIFYRLLASGDSGATQALTEVSLRPGGRR